MKKSAAPAVSPDLVFVKGQLWKFGERCIQIHYVGKLLIEHREVALEHRSRRSRVRVISVKELQEFLVKQKAVLLKA